MSEAGADRQGVTDEFCRDGIEDLLSDGGIGGNEDFAGDRVGNGFSKFKTEDTTFPAKLFSDFISLYLPTAARS